MPEDAIHAGYLLEHAPGAKVVDFLSGQYDRVKFTPHPTMNGFYALGSAEDLLQIKRELATLDRPPQSPPEVAKEFLPVRFANLDQTRELLETIIPDVRFRIDRRLKLLVCQGSPGALHVVREILVELDRPNPQGPTWFY